MKLRTGEYCDYNIYSYCQRINGGYRPQRKPEVASKPAYTKEKAQQGKDGYDGQQEIKIKWQKTENGVPVLRQLVQYIQDPQLYDWIGEKKYASSTKGDEHAQDVFEVHGFRVKAEPQKHQKENAAHEDKKRKLNIF